MLARKEMRVRSYARYCTFTPKTSEDSIKGTRESANTATKKNGVIMSVKKHTKVTG